MVGLVKIGLGVALLWYGVLRGANGLLIKVKDYAFQAVDLTNGKITLRLNLYIKNPLLVGLTIKGIDGKVYAQGMQVGTVNTTYNYYLAGGHSHILPVLVDLDISQMGQAAWANIQSGDIRTLTVAFDGHVYVGGANVPVPVQFELDYNGLMG